MNGGVDFGQWDRLRGDIHKIRVGVGVGRNEKDAGRGGDLTSTL